MALVASTSCHLAIRLSSDLFFGLVRKASALVRSTHFGRPRDVCLGLPWPPVILGSRLDGFACSQASAKVRTEAIAQVSWNWTELPRKELFF